MSLCADCSAVDQLTRLSFWADWDSDRKGLYAQLKAETRALELGYNCSRADHAKLKYDLILELPSRKLFRAQIKWALRESHGSEAVYSIGLAKTNKSKVKKLYTANDIDVFIFYMPEYDKLVWLPIEMLDGAEVALLRHRPPKPGCSSFALARSIDVWKHIW